MKTGHWGWAALLGLAGCAEEAPVAETIPPARVHELSRMLLSGDVGLRDTALAEYRRNWAALRESVAQDLCSEDLPARLRALELFGRFGSERDAPLLRIALRDPSESVRRHAATALAELRDAQAATQLIDIACSDAAVAERATMLSLAARIAPARSWAICVRLAKSRIPANRCTAARTMSTLPERTAGEWLAKLSRDPDEAVRAAAAAPPITPAK